jgi:hypothetical protein
VYSARKNRANPLAEYSTLYPETSSVSASGRSKGCRLVSASEVTKKIIQIGSSGPTSHTVLLCTSTLVEKLAVPAIRMSEISVEPRPTSYEILCAADRSPPRKAYLELLDHPALITECTLSDEIAKRNSSPSRKSARNAPSPIGNTIHPVLASPKVKIGDTRKMNVLALLGRIDSLTKSFIASVSGWNRP